MTPREELEELRAKKAARIAELEAKASGGAVPIAAPPAEEDNFFGDLAKGAKANLDKTALGLKGLLPQAVQDWGDKIDAAAGSRGLTKATAVQTPDSFGGKVGDIGTEIATMLVPGNAALKAANVVNKGLKLTRAAKLAMPAAVATDLGANAAISAATTPEDRDTAAMFGAGGAAAGRVAGRVLGGTLRESVSPQAKVLMDAGVHLTPGQALSGPQASTIAKGIRKAEDSIRSLPLVGDVISNAQERSVQSFNVNRINDALKSIGGKVDNAGLEGLAHADDLISRTYDAVKPHIRIELNDASHAVLKAQLDAKQIPLFDVGHEAKLGQFIERRIKPLLNRSRPIDGATAKEIDSEIGEHAREYLSSGPGNKQLGEAFAKLRTEWRTAMQGTTPEARQTLKDADKAYAKLLPLQEAGNKTASGIFTPKQLADQLRRLKMPEDPLAQAGRQVLPLTVPDSGTAGRLILGQAITPASAGAGLAGAAGAAGLTIPAVAAAGAAAMYTKPGLKALTEGVHPIVKALRRSKAPYDPHGIEDIIRNLTGRTTSAVGME